MGQGSLIALLLVSALLGVPLSLGGVATGTPEGKPSSDTQPAAIEVIRPTYGYPPPNRLRLSQVQPAQGEGVNWTDLQPENGPAGRNWVPMTYDSESDRIILFGGFLWQSGHSAETWAYDFNANTWTNMVPSSNPQERGSHGMTYDSGSDRVILFGGNTNFGRSNDTWAYDFNADTWTLMNPETKPSPRGDFAMTYDAESDRVILFGGYDGAYDDEMWAYDLEADAWTRMSPGTGPARMSHARMAYDAESDRVILFGGWNGFSAETDTWAYDFNADTWTRLSPSNAPPGKTIHRMVYDVHSDRILLFGGNGPVPYSDETWTYDYNNNAWTRLEPETSPPGRAQHAMAFDSESGVAVIFGGYRGGPSLLSDTWAFGSVPEDTEAEEEWVLRNPNPTPSPRGPYTMAYDLESDRVILVSGATNSTFVPDVWAYDFNDDSWLEMNPSSGPLGRGWHALAYDGESDRVILYGGHGSSGQTWAYDYNSDSWENRNPPSAPPPLLELHDMAYDAESDRVILFGGVVQGIGLWNWDVWAYDFNSNTWTTSAADTAPTPLATDLAYDAESDRVISFGLFEDGSSTWAETWAYDFNSDIWTNVTPEIQPSPRYACDMVYDTQADRVVLFGGWDRSSSRSVRDNQTWLYDFNNNAWSKQDTPTSPSPRVIHGMAYDSESQHTILFGGNIGATNYSRETWIYAVDLLALAPGAPLSLRGEPHDGFIRLRWNPPSQEGGSPVSRYRIYRGTVPGEAAFLAEASVETLTYGDTAVTPGVSYAYQVSAVNAAAEGPRSNEVAVRAGASPAVPQSLTATAAYGAVTLSWEPPITDGGYPLVGYRLYRGEETGPAVLLAEIAEGLAYLDGNVSNGVRYSYAVSAVNRIGESPLSNRVSALPGDFTAPGIAMADPQDGETLDSLSVSVSGTAWDDVALERVEVSTDGESWVLASGTAQWKADVTLVEGPNTIVARAIDASGNSAVVSVTVLANPPPAGISELSLILTLGLASVIVVAIIVALWVARRKD